MLPGVPLSTRQLLPGSQHNQGMGGTWCTSHVESGLCKGINLTTRFNMHLELFGRLALALSVGALLTPEQLQDGYTAVTAACPLEAMTNGNCKDLVHAP